MWSRNLLALALFAASGPALADEAQLIAQGRKLLAENECNGACHARKAPDGDPLKLYTRPNPKVTSFDGLKRQVTRCVAGTGAQIAPDEIDSVVAALNADYYKFK
jgi:hypothetical protein